jgi:hypothetical protein
MCNLRTHAHKARERGLFEFLCQGPDVNLVEYNPVVILSALRENSMGNDV